MSTNKSEGIRSPLHQRIDSSLLPFTRFLYNISAVAIFGILAITVIDILGRYLLNLPLIGSMEIVELLMVLAAYPTFIWIEHQDRHLNVDMVSNSLGPVWQPLFVLFHKTVCLAFLVLLGYEMLLQTLIKLHEKEITLLLGLPIWPVLLLCAISLWLLAAFAALSLVKAWWQAMQRGKRIHAIVILIIALIIAITPFILAGSRLGFSRNAFGGVIMAYMFLLILTGMPIGIAMIVAGLQGFILLSPSLEIALATAGSAPFSSVASIAMSVIPMFVLLGELALVGGISSDLFNTASKWLTKLPGGLAIASVSGCAGFAAVCGDSLATAMTMASVGMPAMKEQKYNMAFSAASLSIGGTLGILIPPSMGFIMYAIVTEESVAKLFMAGIIPGIMLTVVICLTIVIRVKLNPSLAPRSPDVSWSERFRSLWGVLPMVGLFIIIMGGILAGICTPTEGGALGSFACLLYCLVRRRMTFRQLSQALRATASLSGKIFIILVGVTIVGSLLASTRLPMVLTDLIADSGLSKYVVLALIILLYTVLGMLMNVIPMILLILPSLFPLVLSLGFDPIWFGVITVLLMELGQITPPVGVLVFALSSVVPEVPVASIFREVIPYFFAIFLCVLLLILFPQIALWLPSLM